MGERCDCTTNPNEHDHRFLRPVTVAAAVGRPIATIETWRKSGKLATTGKGRGQVKVCSCCAAQLHTTTSKRWVKTLRRRRVVPAQRLSRVA